MSSIVKTELEKRKFSVEIVDGDKAREKYEIPLGFDRKDIEKNNILIANFTNDER